MSRIDPTGKAGGVGGFITGGLKGAFCGAIAGGIVGSFAPNASYNVGSMVTSAVLNGLASMGGQLVGAAVSEKPMETLSQNFSLSAIAGASIAGLAAPLWADIANGSIIAEGVMGGLFTGYSETVGALFERILSDPNSEELLNDNGCE